jgi:hypothetical protein
MLALVLAAAFALPSLGLAGESRWQFLSLEGAATFTTQPDDYLILELGSESVDFCPFRNYMCEGGERLAIYSPDGLGRSRMRNGLDYRVYELLSDVAVLGQHAATHRVVVSDDAGEEVFNYFWSAERGVVAISLVGADYHCGRAYVLVSRDGPLSAGERVEAGP